MIMTVLLQRTVARLYNERVVRTLAKVSAAALLMGVALTLLARWLAGVLSANVMGELAILVGAGLAGSILYVAALSVMRVPEVDILLMPVRRLAARKQGRG